MTEDTRLDLEKTYAAILQAARARRFISYGDLAAASGVPWSHARRLIPQHLGQLVTLAHERDWPMPSAIVVNKDDVATGRLEGSAREGFLAAARDVGFNVADPEQFVKDQQEKIFAWAPSAPDTLGLTQREHTLPRVSGPRFVQYFAPVLDALRDMGGEARPKDICAWIIKNTPVSESEVKALNKNGQSKFENDVAWARFYLVKASLIDDRRRGIWTLTSDGRETKLDHARALELYKDVQADFRGEDAEGEEAAPPPTSATIELFDDPSRQFWFGGAIWDGDDQLERFIREGIWENGYEDRFTELVRKIRPGDRIAIKSSFVQRHNLPFDVDGKPVSAMRIKAIGTVIENVGDGKTVRVDWQALQAPRDWYFYTYRTTLVEADPDDDLARRLILFAFANAPQDYQFWLSQPYFAKKFGVPYLGARLIPLTQVALHVVF